MAARTLNRQQPSCILVVSFFSQQQTSDSQQYTIKQTQQQVPIYHQTKPSTSTNNRIVAHPYRLICDIQ